MPRQARQCPGGLVYHIWNRAAGRLRLFKKPEDYAAFNRVLLEAHQRHPIRILDWCLMPNHWHFVVHPEKDGEVTAFFKWLTHVHAMRAITHRRVMGMGPLYQGRFKSLPVESDEHLETLLRYVARNPLRAKLVKRANQWRWSGQWERRKGDGETQRDVALDHALCYHSAMPRRARQCPGGLVYHIWNRAAGRLRLFKKPEDYAAFNRVLLEAHQRHPIRILDWCLMPNHWHFVVHPEKDGEVTAFFKWLTHVHAMRAITHRRVMGMGPLYQGRFKSLPVESDEHLETLLRYVARNPLRAKLVKRANQWRWSGQWQRRKGDEAMRGLLSAWPIDEPENWGRWLEADQEIAEVSRLREHIRRSRPFGSAEWTVKQARLLGLEYTLNPHGGRRHRPNDNAHGKRERRK